jgi:hypothetical protein
MLRLQLARARQRVHELKARRNTLEHLALQHHAMLAASLLERRFRPGAPAAYYLSIPSPQTSRHRYVRKADVELVRRQTGAWREFSSAMAEWVRLNGEIERLLRQVGKGRCRKIYLAGRKVL